MNLARTVSAAARSAGSGRETRLGSAERGARTAAPACADRFDARCALLLDFDGTLVDLAENPDAVRVPSWLPALLQEFCARLEGRVAIVSGRPIVEIDRFLEPLRLCAAGVHGAEMRLHDHATQRAPVASIDAAATFAAAAASRFPGLRLERKHGALALHYRRVPDLAGVSLAIMDEVTRRAPELAVLHGKMVVEAKPRGVSKGRAVEALMASAPFRGSRPWYFGDDVTDESAFESVQSMGGVAVKVGAGPSVARHRLNNPASVRTWLGDTVTLLCRQARGAAVA